MSNQRGNGHPDALVNQLTLLASATLTASSTMSHVHHFCDTLPQEPFVDMRPAFLFEEDDAGVITATVTLPSCVSPDVRSARGLKGWLTERAAMKDAAFQCYAALYHAGLLNDNLLPLTHDWEESAEPSADLAAMISVDAQIKPLWEMAKAWSTPDIHQTKIVTKLKHQATDEHLVMMMITPMKITQVPPLTLYWNEGATYTVTLKNSSPWSIHNSGSLDSLRQITKLIHQSTSSDRTVIEGTDLIVLFGPYLAEKKWRDWLNFNHDRTAALKLFRDGQTRIKGFVRTPEYRGSLFTFCNWHIDKDEESEGTLGIECAPLLQRRNLEAPAILSSKECNSINGGLTDATHRFIAQDCTIDALDIKYARFNLMIPAILRKVEAYTVATRLQQTILKCVGIKSVQLVGTAITAPSADSITDYQRLQFIGDAVLKYVTAVQLYADHANWPEGFLSKRRESLVSNGNLARAALNKGLGPYILTEAPKRREWTPPLVSEANQPVEERSLRMKVLADVTEALIGAAFVDSGFAGARSCINIFIPSIRVAEPKIVYPPVDVLTSEEMLQAESMIGYKFQNKAILLEALTHPSHNTDRNRQSYQRLGFLGDAILDILVFLRLSQCRPALSQGRMTQLRAALVNTEILGFVCMRFSISRDIVDVEERRPDVFTEVRRTEAVQLWKIMQHQSWGLIKAQAECCERYDQQCAEIHRRLTEGPSYPWAELVRMHAGKFHSDLIQSIIGAIFVDSGQTLSDCQRFVDRIGLGMYAKRMTENNMDVVHPRDTLQHLATPKATETVVEQYGDEESLFRCGVIVNGSEIVEVDQCRSRDEAIVIGADTAISYIS
jgi:dsRNA-specific ribonuclease